MERLPKFEVIGAVPEEEKALVAQGKQEIFEKQGEILPEDVRVRFETAEYKKTPEQITILNFINEETNRLLVEAGVETFDIPINNYHILPLKELDYYFESKSDGSYSDRGKAIGLSSELRSNLLRFTVVAFHEALHMKSRYITEAYIGQDGKVNEHTYRSGVRAMVPYKKDKNGRGATHFSGLDEGIVAWQEKLSFLRLLEIPELAKEKEKYYTEESVANRKKISEDLHIPEDEIFVIEDMAKMKFSGVGYRPQREVLEYVCEEIKNEFGDKYTTKEDVFKEFLKANFDGNLISIARLMKKSFGEDSLRILAMMKNKDRDQDIGNVFEMLKKLRRRVIKV